VIRLSFRRSMLFCIEKPRGLVTTLLSSELDICLHIAWFEGELVLWRVYCVFCFSRAFSLYSPKSLCFTCYTSLYLLNYAYH
jgi:hypothetical protein